MADQPVARLLFSQPWKWADCWSCGGSGFQWVQVGYSSAATITTGYTDRCKFCHGTGQVMQVG